MIGAWDAMLGPIPLYRPRWRRALVLRVEHVGAAVRPRLYKDSISFWPAFLCSLPETPLPSCCTGVVNATLLDVCTDLCIRRVPCLKMGLQARCYPTDRCSSWEAGWCSQTSPPIRRTRSATSPTSPTLLGPSGTPTPPRTHHPPLPPQPFFPPPYLVAVRHASRQLHRHSLALAAHVGVLNPWLGADSGANAVAYILRSTPASPSPGWPICQAVPDRRAVRPRQQQLVHCRQPHRPPDGRGLRRHGQRQRARRRRHRPVRIPPRLNTCMWRGKGQGERQRGRSTSIPRIPTSPPPSLPGPPRSSSCVDPRTLTLPPTPIARHHGPIASSRRNGTLLVSIELWSIAGYTPSAGGMLVYIAIDGGVVTLLVLIVR